MWQWREVIISRLARLRLTIHPGAQVRAVREGIPFLGFVVYPDHRRLKRRKGIYYRQRLRALVRDYAQANVSFDQLTASVQGWVNHVRYGNTIGLRKAVLTRQMIPPPPPIKQNRYE